MQNVIQFILNLFANISPIAGGVSTACVALIGVFMLIPGDQPEKFLQGVVDFLASFSKK